MEAGQRERYRAAQDSITRLSSRGLPGTDLLDRLPGLIRGAVAFRTGGWVRLDPMSMLPMPGLLLQAGHDRARRIIHNEYFEPDVVKFRDLARRPVPVQSLWQATRGEPHRSLRYRSILAELGYGDELRAVFRCGDGAWGAACIARSVTDPPFSREDTAFIARVCEPVARGLRLSHLLAGDAAAGPAPPGALILDGDGSVISQTDTAGHWLGQLPQDRARGMDLPLPVLSAVDEIRAGRASSGVRLRTVHGRWLRLHATRLTAAGPGGAGQIVVIIEPAGAAELSPLILELHGLTSRERQITQLLLRGLPTAEIARSLFISRHTLSDHMKAIFAKLGVSSRPELTAMLLDRVSAVPSPGG